MKISIKSALPEFSRPWTNVRKVCSSRDCHNRQFASWIPGTLPGIEVGSQWYCCVDCFVLGLRSPLEALSNRQVLEIQRQPRLSLNLVLFSKGYLTSEQARMVTALCESTGEDFEAALLRTGHVNEKQMAAARSAQWGYPAFSSEQSGHWVEANLPLSLFRAFRAAPLHYSANANRFLIGFVSRVEPQVLETIERLTGSRVEPCFITPSEFEEQMERVTFAGGYEESFVVEPGAPDKMARTVGRAAVKVAAREAILVQCKDHVVARVIGKRGIIDVIFKTKSSQEFGIHRNFEPLRERAAITG